MDETAVDRVRRRRKELSDEIAKLQEEQDRLDAYLLVHEEFSRPAPRTISGQGNRRAVPDRAAPCPRAHDARTASGRAQEAVRGGNQCREPARLVSTRMSALASVESTENGWRLVPSGIGVESEAYE